MENLTKDFTGKIIQIMQPLYSVGLQFGTDKTDNLYRVQAWAVIEQEMLDKELEGGTLIWVQSVVPMIIRNNRILPVVFTDYKLFDI